MNPELTRHVEARKKALALVLALYRVTDRFPASDSLRRRLRDSALEIYARVSEYGFDSVLSPDSDTLFLRIETILGYLELAQTRTFVKDENILVLKREYRALNGMLRSAPEYSAEAKRQSPQGLRVGNSSSEYRLLRSSASHTNIAEPVRFDVARNTGKSGREHLEPLQEELLGNKGFSKGPIGHERQSRVINERQKTILEHMERAGRKARLGDLHALFEGVSSKTIQRDLHALVSKNILRRDGEKRWTTYYLAGS